MLTDFFRVENAKTCWPWTGNLSSRGYGTIAIGRPIFAHRLVFLRLFHYLPKPLCVLHKCDNPRCVNPFHFFVGTKADNMRDKVKKGRQSSLPGVQNPWAKFDQSTVDFIRERFVEKRGELARWARDYGVTHTTIRSLIDCVTYK